MSRRKHWQLAVLGLLAIALGAPDSAAQAPNPWHNPASAVAPAPRAKQERVAIEFHIDFSSGNPRWVGVGVVTASGAAKPAACCEKSCCESGSCPAVAATTRPVQQAVLPPITVRSAPPSTTAVIVGSPHSDAQCANLPAQGRLAGTWYREMPGTVASFTCTGEEMKATVVWNAAGTLVTISFIADCAIAKDGTVHGVITGADVEVKGGTEPAGLELAELDDDQFDRAAVEGTIFGRVKGGFTVDLGGAVAFLPGSQVDVRPVRDVDPLMGQAQQFAILRRDRRSGNIVVSRRAATEWTRAEGRTPLIVSLSDGNELD